MLVSEEQNCLLIIPKLELCAPNPDAACEVIAAGLIADQ